MTINVFLTDDHNEWRRAINILLKPEKDIAITGEASGGRQTLELAKKLKPHVVVMDIIMPDINGFKTTELLLEHFPFMRVIICSIQNDLEFVRRAFRSGALGFQMKDTAAEELATAIRTVNSGKRFVSRPIAEKIDVDLLKTI